MKKLLSIMLALVLILSMSTVAFAADNDDAASKKQNQEASFNKTYTATNKDVSKSPAETFTFTFSNGSVTNATSNTVTAPEIPSSTISYAEGGADGAQKAVSVALSSVTWPSVGVYVYDVKESVGNTLGVTYDTNTLKMKVTVAYDQGTNTYYTAFVTLSLADENKDGITDVKTGGFTNTYSAGSLAVTKTVEGSMAETEKEFDVTVTFTNNTGKTMSSVISYVEDGNNKTIATTAWKDNSASVKIALKHNETITFTNIPYGVTYSVVEDNYTSADKGGYNTAEYTFSDSAKKIDSEKDTVNILNKKDVTIDTGIALDSMPYFLMLAVACMGLVVFFMKKRNAREY